MAAWQATVHVNPDQPDMPDEHETVSGRPELSYSKYPEGDFAQYYRDILEHALKSDPRIAQGHAVQLLLI